MTAPHSRRRSAERSVVAQVATLSLLAIVSSAIAGAQTVRLPLHDFEALRLRAQPARPPEAKPATPWALESLDATIRLGESTARVEQRIELALLDGGEVSVPLGGAGALVAAELGTLDGRIETEPDSGWRLHARGRGDHRLVLSSVVALEHETGATRATSRLRLRWPSAAASRGRITDGARFEEAESTGGPIWREVDGSWTFLASPGAGEITITFRGPRHETAVGLERRFVATSATATSLARTQTRAQAWIELRMTQGELPEVELDLPPGFEVAGVAGPVGSWRRDAARLLVTPLEPVRSSIAFTVHLTAPALEELATPLVVPVGAHRTHLYAQAAVGGDGLLELVDDGGARVANEEEQRLLPEAIRAAGGRLLAVPDASRLPRWRATWAEGTAVLAAQVDRLVVEWTVGTAGRAGCRIWLEVRNRGDERLAVTLPGFEWTVATRDEEGVVPGIGPGGALELPLAAGETAQVFHLAGHLAFDYDPSAGTLRLPLPALSAPAARVEARALLPSGPRYALRDASRAGAISAPPTAVRAALRRDSLASNAIARQMASGAPAGDGTDAGFSPVPPGHAEVGAAWSALSPSPAPLELEVETRREASPWF